MGLHATRRQSKYLYLLGNEPFSPLVQGPNHMRKFRETNSVMSTVMNHIASLRTGQDIGYAGGKRPGPEGAVPR